MKPTEAETTAEVNIPEFIKDLRILLALTGTLDDNEITEAHEDYDSHYNDTLDRGIDLGQRDMADDVRAIFAKHGVSL